MARSPPLPKCPAQAPEIERRARGEGAVPADRARMCMRVDVPGKVNGTRAVQHRRAGAGHDLRRDPARADGRRGAGAHRRRAPRARSRASSASCRSSTAWACSRRRRGPRSRPRRRSKVTWSRKATGWGFSSDKGYEQFAAVAKDLDRKGVAWETQGRRGRGRWRRRRQSSKANTAADYAYHAQMEPLNSVAAVSPAGDAVEIWVRHAEPDHRGRPRWPRRSAFPRTRSSSTACCSAAASAGAATATSSSSSIRC